MHELDARDTNRQAWTHKRGADLARPFRPCAFELQSLDATDQELDEHANLGGLRPESIGPYRMQRRLRSRAGIDAAKADRTDALARRHARRTRACARTGRYAAVSGSRRIAMRSLVLVAGVDVGIRRIGDEPGAVLFGGDELLADFGARESLSKGTRRNEQGGGQSKEGNGLHFRLHQVKGRYMHYRPRRRSIPDDSN
jgi:hypothetical protein